jgi:hypothetical protein
MKFKKDDLGLYFAFALIGGGIGLLAGSLLTNWLERRAQEKVNAEDEIEEEHPADRWIGPREAKLRLEINQQELQEARNRTKDLTQNYEYQEVLLNEELEVTGEEEEDEDVDKIDLDDEKWKKYTNLPEPIKKKKSVVKKQKGLYENLSQYSDEELLDFISEHDPNVFAQQMLYNGTMTMEQVLGVIMREQEALEQDPFNYAEQYHIDNVAEAEELGDFDAEFLDDPPEELGIIDNRWQVYVGMPDGIEDKFLREIQWDSEDNSFYMIRKGSPFPYDIASGIGHNTWETIEPYLLRGLSNIYVVDLQKPRYYFFYKIPELGEDDSILDNGSDST